MKILITGANGFLGKNVYNKLSERYEIKGTYNRYKSKDLVKLDLSDSKSILELLNSYNPDVIVHTAAITDLNQCEKQPYIAKIVNTNSTNTIAKWCKDKNTKLIYLSTDYVFDGENGPYREKSETGPLQIYGYTKLMSEILIENRGINYAIVRIGILHGFNDRFDKNTVTMQVINGLKNEQEIVLDDGRIKYPTLIDDVSSAIEKIIEDDLIGTFHVASQEPVTRYEWGLRISRVFGFNESLIIPDKKLDKMSFPARPKDIKLLDTMVGFKIRCLDDSLEYLKYQLLRGD
ncbi:SDR family oxidoreductase [Lutispora saccharofermentans]|uniref:dTDP-4-dehydrorhamnose reductase n=1 Tax=Lutispora saccharofermentans TaxID=3024236 RepID=A0ABT1NFH9_9FIRM|nr:SDR family oxidoreductase [Lutispora saccharofermentans]MCQ1528601.1 SDR family oxidoreductase [Lutispora saccharofermentans]